MNSFITRVQRCEFELRIVVSLLIVLGVCVTSYVLVSGAESGSVIAGRQLGISRDVSLQAGFVIAALLMTVASLLRMWAGTILTSDRVMAFPVQRDRLYVSGPYRIVRNPIYLADLIAMSGFALCLPWPGVALPLLLYAHYVQLVRYEECSLADQFGGSYTEYAFHVSRIIPNLAGIRSIPEALKDVHISSDGMRHNALYVLFIPGLLIAAFTEQFFYAVFIGLLAVYDWAVLHTKKGLAAKDISGGMQAQRERKRKSVFDDILYAQCWEDPAADRAALAIGPEDVVFSITSGGCNCLAFLLDDPRSVIALDMSPYQNHLLQLKIAAFRRLEYGELLEFVGVRPSKDRQRLYMQLRDALCEEGKTYWDAQEEKIAMGIIHCGRYERYMQLLRVWLRRVVGGTTITRLFESACREDREILYDQKWDTLWWRAFTRILLSRTTMTLLFDKAFFTFVDPSLSLGRQFAQRTRYALTELPLRENYFLSYILLGRYYSEDHLPPYLRRENFEIIRSRLDRIDIVTDSCAHFFTTLPNSSITKFNFSNIFEWMSADAYEQLLRDAVRVATDHAVLTYRNLLVARERPESLALSIHPVRALAGTLLQRDLSFIYNKYVVERVDKGLDKWSTQSLQSATAAR